MSSRATGEHDWGDRACNPMCKNPLAFSMKTKTMFVNWLLLSVIMLLSAECSQATTIAWTNTAGGLWSVPANWSPNSVPGSSDDVFITANGSYSVTLDPGVGANINSLTLGALNGQQTQI